jgi:hypothetical protein
MKLRLVGTVVLALGALASSSAYAGNGNGKDDPAAAPAAVADKQDHGNSANAPGQVKKEEAQAPAAAAAAASSAGSPEAGVKPSSDTAHETHAPASSDQTKLYGNGQTAGQIAQQNGARPSTILHGPGNSQPHKAAPCTGGHEVDVHALKGKRQSSCGGSPTPHPTPNPTADPGKPNDPAGVPDPTPSPSSPGLIPGVVAVGSPRPQPQLGENAYGVLEATGGVAGRRATLPFTGFDLAGVAFLGAGLMLIGAALCRRARTVPARKTEEEAGS